MKKLLFLFALILVSCSKEELGDTQISIANYSDKGEITAIKITDAGIEDYGTGLKQNWSQSYKIDLDAYPNLDLNNVDVTIRFTCPGNRVNKGFWHTKTVSLRNGKRTDLEYRPCTAEDDGERFITDCAGLCIDISYHRSLKSWENYHSIL